MKTETNAPNSGRLQRPERPGKFRLFKRATGHEIPQYIFSETASTWEMNPALPRDAFYYFRFEYKKRVYLRCLETNDATEAQRRAKVRYDEITASVQQGDYRRLDATKLRAAACSTIGEILPTYRLRARINDRTKQNNIAALSYIIRKVSTAELTDEQVRGQRLDVLTKKLLLDFQDKMAPQTETDCLRADRQITTANSYIRQARSLFKDDMLEHYKDAKLRLPDLIGFKSVTLLEEPDHTYEPVPLELLQKIRDAAPALKATDANAYKIYLLSLGCGLRAGEIAHLCHSHIVPIAQPAAAPGAVAAPERFLIVLRTRRATRTKNKKPRYVPVEKFIMDELNSLKPITALPLPVDPAAAPAAAPADYVLVGSDNERSEESFRRFGAWLTGLGWTRLKKAHELRKEFGSLVAAQAGFSAGPKLLGNSPEVFAAHYHGLREMPEIKIFG